MEYEKSQSFTVWMEGSFIYWTILEVSEEEFVAYVNKSELGSCNTWHFQQTSQSLTSKHEMDVPASVGNHYM